MKLRFHLMLLAGSIVVPILLLCVVLAAFMIGQARERFQLAAMERTRAVLSAVEAELRGSITTLEALATAESLDKGDLRQFHAQILRVLPSRPGWTNITLASPEGQQLLNARRAFGTELPVVADLPATTAVAQAGRPAIGMLSTGPVSGQLGVPVRVPVQRDGVVKFVLTGIVNPASFDDLLRAQRLPSQWAIAIVDAGNRFVARIPRVPPGSNPSKAFLEALQGESREGWFRGETLEGVSTYQSFSQSGLSGWGVGVAIPATEVEAGARLAALYFAIGVLISILVVLTLATLLGRRIARPIGMLSESARALGQGTDLPQREHTAITEVVEVAEALERAALAIRTKENDLRASLEELRQSEERYRLAAQAAAIGSWTWDLRADAIEWSGSYRQLYGFAPEAPLSFALWKARLVPADSAHFTAVLEKAVAARGGYRLEVRVVHPMKGVRWILEAGRFIASEMPDVQPDRLIGIGIDVTDLKQAEEGLRDMATSLERRVTERTGELALANQELQAFSYTVSHDLRSPLRSIQGYARALTEDCGAALGSVGTDYCARIAAAGEWMERLIEDLLGYSRLARSQIELGPVDLDQVVSEALEQLRETVAATSAVVELRAGLGTVRAYRPVLLQVLVNLLDNAMKFVAPKATPRIAIWSERRDGLIRVYVEDNGIGINEAHRERIFNAFERLHGDDAYFGSGIGLAIVKRGMERQAGTCGVESAPRSGTRFWIELPAK